MAKKTVGRDTTPLPAPRKRRRYGDDLRGEAVQMLLDGRSAASVVERLGIANGNGNASRAAAPSPLRSKRAFENLRRKTFASSGSATSYLFLNVPHKYRTSFRVRGALQEKDPEQKLAWRPLRRGVADLHRRFELSRRSNATYLEAMSAVEVEETVGTLAGPASRPAKRGGRRYRGLNLLSAEDSQLLRAIQRGEHTISGFRNHDLCAALFGDAKGTVQERKRRSARTTRRLQLLRAHGLIRKIPRSHRWQLTPLGRNVSSAAPLVGTASLKTLNNAAEFCSK